MNELEKLFELARRGSADAMYEIACRQLEGDGLRKDVNAAYENFRMLKERGYENAEIQIAKMCCYGYFGDEMTSSGAELLIEKAEEGNAVACYELGIIFEYGIGCNVNMDNAIGLYTRAAEAGLYPAAVALERLGYNVNDDIVDDYDDFAYTNTQKNHTVYQNYSPEQLLSMGKQYLEGRGVQKDKERAEKLFIEAENAGLGAASLALGWYYLQGNMTFDLKKPYIKSNELKAIKNLTDEIKINAAAFHFKKAVGKGEVLAYLGLALGEVMRYTVLNVGFDSGYMDLMHEATKRTEKRNVIAKTVREALKYIDLAKNAGVLNIHVHECLVAEVASDALIWNAMDELYEHMKFKCNSLSNISISYADREKCSKFLASNPSYLEACEYCKRQRAALEISATRGDRTAQKQLGTILKYGDYFGTDYKSSQSWLMMAADAGDPEAMMECADFFFGFYGGKKNVNRALELLEKAAESGKAECICALANALARGLGSQRDSYDMPRALTLYQKLAAQGNGQALYELADLYGDSRTRRYKRDNPEALLKRAAERGHKEARRKLSEKYGYKYTMQELNKWFEETLRDDVLYCQPCEHCGSTLYSISKSFLGKDYYECPMCHGKHVMFGFNKIKI